MAKNIPAASTAKFRTMLRSSISVLALFSAAHVRAQSQHAVTGASATDPLLTDIVVTARRREENLQSVPIAITALTPQVLRDNNVVQIQDIQALVPSIAITSANVGQRESANVSIRGQGYGSIAGQPAVAIYLNEVPIVADHDGALAGGPGLFFDLENVQVLKGPQGTLFGRNTMGGAVLLQSTRPTNEFGGHIQVGLGNYNNREIEGAINIPIVDEKLLFRIAGIAQKRDGFTRVLSMPNHPNGLDLDNRNFWGLRGSLTFMPSDNFRNDLIITNQSYSSNGTSNILVDIDTSATSPFVTTYGLAATQAVLAQQNALGPRVRVPNSVDTSGTNGSLFAIENITRIKLSDDISIRNLLGFRKAVFDYRADLDGTPFQVFDVSPDRYPVQQFSNELQLQGKSLGGKLDWILGGFYADQGPPNTEPVSPVGLAVLLPVTAPSAPNILIQRQLTLQTKALFGQVTLEPIEGLRATGGLRYTWDERQDGALVAGKLVQTPSPSEALTYTLGLDYQVTPKTLLYVASRRGYRAGGSTGANVGGNPVVFKFKPEFVTDYEVGIKSDIELGTARLRINADAYYQNYSNIQVNQLFPQGSTLQGVVVTDLAGVNVTQNGGKARLWGTELEASLVLSKYVRFGANFSYLNFKYGQFAAGIDGAALEAGKNANRIPVTYGLSAQFTLPTDESVGEVSLGANYHWQAAFGDFLGSSFRGPSNIPSYGVLNLSLNWKDIGGGPFDAQFFITNATNKTYQNGGISFLGFNERTYGEPRMYGLRLSHRFGGEGK